VVDVEGEGEEQKFTFRGEPKPVSVPDVPPVELAAGPAPSGGAAPASSGGAAESAAD
jgi:ATP-dependent Clp protease ATP-binding subunit ClpC